MDTQIVGLHTLEMARAARQQLMDSMPHGGPDVVEWMAKCADMLGDWKVVGCAVLSYVLAWRVGEFVVRSPKHTDVQGRTLWSIRRSKRLAGRQLGLVPRAWL